MEQSVGGQSEWIHSTQMLPKAGLKQSTEFDEDILFSFFSRKK